MMKQEANQVRKYDQEIRKIIGAEPNDIYNVSNISGNLYIIINGNKIIKYGDFDNDGECERKTSLISGELEVLGIIPPDVNEPKFGPNDYKIKQRERKPMKKKDNKLLVYNN